ncbi:MAG: permease [Planctomycetaceae bacterium]|nr:permease [Planctomycetaceae bacterium]
MEPTVLLAALILFAGSLTRSTFGFGEALISMPLLSMVVGTQPAAAIVALTSVVNALVILLTTRWNDIEWDATWRMLVGSLIGVPLGVYALKELDDHIVKLFLAALIISFAAYNLRRPMRATLKTNVLGFVFGFVAGVLGGAYNTLGPPLVIFGTLRQWDPTRFRTTLQTVFLPTSLFVVVSHQRAGFWKNHQEVWDYFLISLPFIFLATFVGRMITNRLDTRRFSRAVFILLLVIGGMLIVNIASDLLLAGS